MRELYPIQEKPLTKAAWWAVFLASTVVASWGFSTFKLFTVTPNFRTGFLWLLTMTALLSLFLLLSYDSYVQESLKGNVQRPVKLFEWMMTKRLFLKSATSKKGHV